MLGSKPFPMNNFTSGSLLEVIIRLFDKLIQFGFLFRHRARNPMLPLSASEILCTLMSIALYFTFPVQPAFKPPLIGPV